MKVFLFLVMLFSIMACNPPVDKKLAVVVNKPTAHIFQAAYKPKNPEKNAADSIELDEQKNAYADYYVVIIDTGTNYYQLDQKMLSISKSKGLSIDTMDRFYDKTKNLITLPDSSSDEIYAGDYFPRRYPSQNLSLEYLDFYKPGSNKKTIALVMGIFENKKSADSALRSFAYQSNAFSIKSKIYVGCIH